MFKELLLFLCLAGIVSAGHFLHKNSAEHNAPRNSPPTISITASSLDASRQLQYDIPLEAKIVQYQQRLNAHQPTALPIQEQDAQPPRTPLVTHVYAASSDPAYSMNPAIVKAATGATPVETNKVTIEAHQSVVAHPPKPEYEVQSPAISQPIYRPDVQYVSVPIAHTAQESVQFTSNTIKSQEGVTANPPRAYITSKVSPPTVQFAQNVVNRPAVQYVSDQLKQVFVKPVTIESHQSVIAHPPTSTVAPVQYVQTVDESPSVSYISSSGVAASGEGVSVTHHAVPRPYYRSSSPAVKPILVPVIFTAEEPLAAQYVGETKQINPAKAVIAQETPVQVPVPVAVSNYPTNQAQIRYTHRESTPVVYTKSIEEKDQASAGLVAHVRPGYGDYSRAVIFSPASKVSSVSFNGNGVSYGW